MHAVLGRFANVLSLKKINSIRQISPNRLGRKRFTVPFLTMTLVALTATAAHAAQPPVSNAGGPYTAVVGNAVRFNGWNSVDPGKHALTYAWDFGDGTTGTGAGVTHVYSTPGLYTATLTVTNISSLTDSATAAVNITAPPVANTGGPYTGVTATAVSFNGTGSTDPRNEALTYNWTFGDGSTGSGPTPTHVYAAAATFTVKLIVTNTDNLSTASTTTAKITKAGSGQPPVARAGGPYTAVAGSPVGFNGSASTDPAGLALTYAWAFGDGGTATGISPSHTYAAAGPYTATLTVTNTASLSNSSTTSVTITAAPQPPVARAGGPYTGVAGTAVSFSGAGSTDPGGLALTYAWAFGDGSTGIGIAPSHTYATAGSYTATLTVTNTASLSNSSTATVTITAAPKSPVANAGGPYTGLAGTSITFSGAGSTDPASLLLTYAWAFGDGSTGTGVSPTHTYATAGSYTATLTVTNTASLSNSSTASVNVTAPPVANVGGPYTGVTGTAISFNGGASTDPRNETLSYAWTFGDGSTGSGATPTHIYTTANTFTVKVTVTNTDGLSNSATTTAKVTAAGTGQSPTANPGGPYTALVGKAVAFNGWSSTDPGKHALTYAWDFGDGNTGTGPAPTHAYTTAGPYTVTLTVTTTASLSNTATASVKITAPPVANPGGPYTGVKGTAVSFNGTGSSDPLNEALTYAWTFGDGSTGNGATPTHVYGTAATFTVKLTVTNTDGLSSAVTTTAKITAAGAAQPPVAKAGGPYTAVAGTAVSFNGSASTDPAGLALTYAWAFGDGGTATGISPSHTYAAAGPYTATLTVTNTASLSNSSTAAVTITAAPQPPVANAGGPYTGVVGTAVSFSGATSTDPAGLTLTYDWTFGDGGTATGIAASHTYAATGTYTATLTVTNTASLSSSSTAAVTITAAQQTITASFGGTVTNKSGATSQATLTLSSAAPTGGIAFTLAVDDTNVATALTSITVPQGSTTVQVAVTGVAPGTTTLRATSPNIVEADAVTITTPTISQAIKHVVVIFDENVSFDHYFATYPNATNPAGQPAFTATPGTPTPAGLSGTLLTSNPNSLNSMNGSAAKNPFRLDRAQAATADQDHSYSPEQTAFNHGSMDLFPYSVGAADSPALANATNAPAVAATNALTMGYFDGNTVTALWNYAQHYALGDHFFESTFGPSTPGALNLASGQTNGAVNDAGSAGDLLADGSGGFSVIGDPDPTGDICSNSGHVVHMTGTNIGTMLTTANISWGFFEGGFDLTKTNTNGSTGCGRSSHSAITGSTSSDYVPHHQPFQYYSSTSNPNHKRPTSVTLIGKNADVANHQYDTHDFTDALASGNMPAVSFLKAPAYQDGHAGYSNPLDEQTFLVNTINAIEQSPFWQDTAIIIAYDDSDGWYDHLVNIANASQTGADNYSGSALCSSPAAPVTATLPGVSASTLHAQGRCGYGPRLPLLVLSPWAKKNVVDSTVTSQASIMRLIEDSFLSGTRLGHGSFDAVSGLFDNMFDLSVPTPPNPNVVILDPATGLVTSNN